MLLIGNLGAMEIILIVLIVVLFFGGKKIPELMKGLGKGVRSFKQGMSEVDDEIKKADNDIKNDIKSDKEDSGK